MTALSVAEVSGLRHRLTNPHRHTKLTCINKLHKYSQIYYKSIADTLKFDIFALFFMVLDLRLTKVGTRRSPFFCAHTPATTEYSTRILKCFNKNTAVFSIEYRSILTRTPPSFNDNNAKYPKSHPLKTVVMRNK